MVNLYEPSQVERAAGLTWTAWLVRAELMPVEALEGAHPRRRGWPSSSSRAN